LKYFFFLLTSAEVGFLDSKEKKLLKTYKPPEFDPSDGNKVTLLKSGFHIEIPFPTGP